MAWTSTTSRDGTLSHGSTRATTVRGMERWEHMAVQAYWHPPASYDRTWVQVVRPDGEVEDVSRGASVPGAMLVLNELAQEGWRLIATESLASGPGIARTYFLGRPRPEPS